MGCYGGWILRTMCLCFIPVYNRAVEVSISDPSVEVIQGDFVILPCAFSTTSPLTRLNVIWTLAPFSSPDSPIQVIVYDHGQVIEEPSLIGRVSFTGIPWKADIILNDTRVSDAGVYHCMVNNPPETGEQGIEELVLNVLVPPSLPVCKWEGAAEAGGTVTLSCSLTGGRPIPELQWHKMEPEWITLPISMEGEMSGWVQIDNVSSQTSGLYRCSASNKLHAQNCFINLSIYTPAAAAATSPGVLQGVLLLLCMSMLLTALLLLRAWLRRSGLDGRRRRGTEESCYNEIQYTTSLTKRSFV